LSFAVAGALNTHCDDITDLPSHFLFKLQGFFEDDKQHVLIESINDPFLHVIHLLLLR